MPDRNYHSSSGGRQGRENTRGWGESARDDDDRPVDREGYETRQAERQYGERDYGESDYGQSGYGRGGYGQSRGGESRYGGSGRERDDSSNYSMGQPGYGRDWGSSGTSQYGRGGYGGRGQASRGQGWREPYGEGQQYGSSGYGYGYGGSEFGGQSRGQHRGKGPKGYQRTDDRLKEMICERLREDPDIDASEISVNVASGRVTFEGSVDSRRTKNAVEDIAEQFDVTDVQNNLRVGAARSTAAVTGEDPGQSKSKRN